MRNKSRKLARVFVHIWASLYLLGCIAVEGDPRHEIYKYMTATKHGYNYALLHCCIYLLFILHSEVSALISRYRFSVLISEISYNQHLPFPTLKVSFFMLL